MATAYHIDQPGAPALVYSAGAQSIAQFTAFKTILKACLVQGYGALPAAGWELINEGTNFLVLRNGSHSGYVCFSWVSVIRVYLSETYRGMAGDVMIGDGLKTGSATGNSVPQALNGYRLAFYSASTSWALVADEKTFVLSLYSHSSITDAELNASANATSGLTLYVGEDSEGNVLSVGGSATAVTSSSGADPAGYFSSNRGMTVLKNPATGLLVDSGSINLVTPSLSGVAQAQVLGEFNVITPIQIVRMIRPAWFGGGAYGGELRGIALVPELQFSSYPSVAAQCLGRPSPMTCRSGSSPIDLGDGHYHFARMGHEDTQFFLITTTPELW